MNMNNDIIKLSENELNSFEPFAKDCGHTESNLYINNELVFKIFKNQKDVTLMKNKEKKVDFLRFSNIEEFILPKHKVYVNNSFVGYTSDYFAGSNTLQSIYYLPLDKKIRLLNQVSLALESIHEQGIILGDINADNILYKDNIIKFADADSASLEDLPNDNYSLALDNQNIDPFKINSIESDIYLLNLLVLELVLYYDVANMPACDKLVYFSDIADYHLPKNIEQIFVHLYDMVNGLEYPIYPHEYLDSLLKHLKKRNR